MKKRAYEFWFVTGTQYLYGPEVIVQVNEDAKEIAEYLDKMVGESFSVVCKEAVSDSEAIRKTILEANRDDNCAGIITWMHTFSPSKMWIAGLTRLQKPWLHFNTQKNRDIPWDSIDMDFMNLNQSAHGDREHGFIGTRLRMNRKVISGYWQDEEIIGRISKWMRSAVGAYESRQLKVCRFGDNMRDVAVTEGDKVEAEAKLGWSVNTHGIGDLIAVLDAVTEEEIDAKMAEYAQRYDMATDNIEAVRYQAKEEVALRKFLEEGGFDAFTDTFQDLQQLKQLPGLATQNLMRDGYGFGAEGDWKMAALTSVIKRMGDGLPGGSAFIEDYTYHMEPGNAMNLGAHMLEVDPVLAAERPKIEVHPLGIGDREDPARLTFSSGAGKAEGLVATLVDMGDRFRMIVNDLVLCREKHEMPKLPVASALWTPMPNLSVSAEAWILAGGAHHSVLTNQIDAECLADFCSIMDIEFIHINKDTKIADLSKELLINDIIWKLK